MCNQSDSRHEKNRDRWRERGGRGRSLPSTTGPFLHSEGAHGTRTLFRNPWNRGRGGGDECRSLGCRIEGCPSFCNVDEGGWRNRREVPFEASIFLSRVGHFFFLDYSQGQVSVEAGEKRRNS